MARRNCIGNSMKLQGVEIGCSGPSDLEQPLVLYDRHEGRTTKKIEHRLDQTYRRLLASAGNSTYLRGIGWTKGG